VKLGDDSEKSNLLSGDAYDKLVAEAWSVRISHSAAGATAHTPVE
jgi:hypothetical protein